jgi:hypothetical protein
MSRVVTFPAYILPTFNIPFFGSSSSSSSSSTETTRPLPAAVTSPVPVTPTPKPGPPTIARAAPDTLRCKTCASELALASQIISRQFTGRHGRAVLVAPPSSGADLINIRIGRHEHRALATGAHTVADISCAVCSVKIGWKYVDAEAELQRYKIGRFILETERIIEHRSWEDADAVRQARTGGDSKDEASSETNEAEMAMTKLIDEWVDVQFDSEDEIECEALFSGTWDAQAVAKRRAKKAGASKK